MSAQQYILPALATVGALLLAKKLYDYSHNVHSVTESYSTLKPQESVTVPTDVFTNYFMTSRGLILSMRRYLVPAAQCKGIVFFLHGFTEHSARYEGLAYEYNKIGYSVCLIDHAGHGASQGDRGFATQFLDFVLDVIEWINFEYNNMVNNKAGWAVPGFGLTPTQLDQVISKNVIISAHSMGGLIATRLGLYLSSNPTAIPWLKSPPCFVLSAPGLALDKKLTDLPILLKVSQLLSKFAPKSIVQTMPDVELSSDPNISIIAKRDPLMNGPHVFARFGAEFINTIQYCQAEAKTFNFPILIMQSDDDNIIDASGAKLFFKNVSTSEENKEYIACKGFHEILFDLDRDVLMEKVKVFLQRQYKE